LLSNDPFSGEYWQNVRHDDANPPIEAGSEESSAPPQSISALEAKHKTLLYSMVEDPRLCRNPHFNLFSTFQSLKFNLPSSSRRLSKPELVRLELEKTP
jgi:hypothetical protein